LFSRYPHNRRFCQTQRSQSDFASEVVRAGLRLLEDHEKPVDMSLDDLRELIREGMDSGPGQPANTVLDRLEAKYSRLAQSGNDGDGK